MEMECEIMRTGPLNVKIWNLFFPFFEFKLLLPNTD